MNQETILESIRFTDMFNDHPFFKRYAKLAHLQILYNDKPLNVAIGKYFISADVKGDMDGTPVSTQEQKEAWVSAFKSRIAKIDRALKSIEYYKGLWKSQASREIFKEQSSQFELTGLENTFHNWKKELENNITQYTNIPNENF